MYYYSFRFDEQPHLPMTGTTAFAKRLLKWHDQHGRKDLPWQGTQDPYKVWVSEIMLQQTQVTTVIPYYKKFIRAFPSVQKLAAAPIDDVLHLWTGLGYYARGHNLHAAAKLILTEYQGHFPDTLESWCALPGVGRSTAGAILAIARGQHQPILDGNVKRVLSRYFAIEGWPGNKAVEFLMWQRAEALTPRLRVQDYTQAIMDLGAIVCRRRQPLCPQCPQRKHCAACLSDSTSTYPSPKPRKTIPIRSVAMLLLLNPSQQVLLARRPPTGLWGGLWSLPECDLGEDIDQWCQSRLGLKVKADSPWSTFRHSFSHFHLDITPVPTHVKNATAMMEKHETVWYNVDRPDRRGLPAPVKRILEQLRSTP